jgi:hypothetical protein
MRSKSPNHRIWFFINNAKDQGKDSIEFYRPVSKLADRKYSELCEELNSMGYYAKDMTNPNGSSLAGIIAVNNILHDVPYYEEDDGPLTQAQLEEIQRIANETHFRETGRHLPSEDDPGWVRLF